MSNTCGTAQQLSCGLYELLCSEDMVFAIERSAQKDEKACAFLDQQTDNPSLILVMYLET
jgi:hypothetical protein